MEIWNLKMDMFLKPGGLAQVVVIVIDAYVQKPF